MEELPIIEFGKYKNKPITEMLKDKNYVDWCKNQKGLLDKYPVIYNIIYNQRFSNENCPTPEHNKMQNAFLDNKMQLKLIDHIYGNNEIIYNKLKDKLNNLYNDDLYKKLYNDFKFPSDIKYKYNFDIEFEAKYNWDILLECECVPDIDKNKIDLCNIQHKKGIECGDFYNKIFNKKLFNENSSYSLFEKKFKRKCTKFNTFFESNLHTKYDFDNKLIIKTSINNSYCLSSWRSWDSGTFKDFINQTSIRYELSLKLPGVGSHLLFCELKPELGDDYPCVLRKMKRQIELTKIDIKKYDYYRYHDICYILIVDHYNSSTTDVNQLKQIFLQVNIKIIFLKELLPLKNNQNIVDNNESKNIKLKDQITLIQNFYNLEVQIYRTIIEKICTKYDISENVLIDILCNNFQKNV